MFRYEKKIDIKNFSNIFNKNIYCLPILKNIKSHFMLILDFKDLSAKGWQKHFIFNASSN